ncbi:hypothetical protein [Streptomyces sp. YGL11-2]|uniref:hypothetical protein n=1 Tax=Streptomyces sp. YGL11-2 TaxID=3414028 RepID=UPI003CEF5D4C
MQPGKYFKSMYVLAQLGNSVETVEVGGLSRAEREAIARHWAHVRNFLEGKPGAERRLQRYEGKRSGGHPPAEFASDPTDIELWARVEPFAYESIYVE